MATEARSKEESSEASPDLLPRWIDRVGAALVAPRLAMEASDSPQGRGRSSSDITLLLFVALVARETHLFASSGWMILDGDWAGAFTVLLTGAQRYLLVGILLLLAGTAALWILAGRKRSMADDFDLVCVTLTPLVAVELLNALLFELGLNIHPGGIVVGYTWFGLLWMLALVQARSRAEKAS